MSMAFRTCPECRWNKVGYYCGRQFTLNGFECINFDKKEKKVIKKDPHKDNIPWLTKEKKKKFKELKGSANSKVDLNKMRDELKDPHKDGEVRQDQLEYLKLKYLYEGEPIDYLDARVPFHYKDVKYQSMDINDYIAMVEEIERRVELEIIKILKERNIID